MLLTINLGLAILYKYINYNWVEELIFVETKNGILFLVKYFQMSPCN